MFQGMTSPGQEYFAGHYRGEPFHYLETYPVTFGGMYGAPPNTVMAQITSLAQHIQNMPSIQAAVTANLPPKQQLFRTVGLVCAVMVRFFTIHPYANGNGHIGRYITWALLFRFGYPPRLWEINQKFGDPADYFGSITSFRSGDPLPLIKFVLSSI
jgi:fido (protein-threonine AMPylation protein)